VIQFTRRFPAVVPWLLRLLPKRSRTDGIGPQAMMLAAAIGSCELWPFARSARSIPCTMLSIAIVVFGIEPTGRFHTSMEEIAMD
jgi:hypothetical protein